MKPSFLLLALLALSSFQTTALAQSIVPANDGTGTVTTLQGNRIDISGGQRSQDGTNLFHSFTQFGLDQHQIANFLSTPATQNILARINGGNASLINGLLQVSGGNSNLFVINPTGIIFGATAQLHVPGSFTATTANAINFSNGSFNAIDNPNYAALTGQPTGFAFSSLQPGGILNAGNLAVSQDQALSLLGGTVISTGSATGGAVTIAAVPGQTLVRLSQAGNPLSLEFTPIQATSANAPTIAQLLTGGTITNATGVQANPDGTIQLTGSGISIQSGDVVAKQVTATAATLSAAQDLKLIESRLKTTGTLWLQANNTVLVRDSLAQPFLAQAGEDLTVQGNQGIDILALNHLQTEGFQSGGKLSLISDGVISGDAHFASGGGVEIANTQGNGGNFVSYYDPIISSAGDVTFGNYTGTSLKVESLGNITGGAINITGPDTNLIAFCGANPCSADALILANQPALILRSGVPTLTETAFLTPPQTLGGTVFTASGTSASGNVTIGDISTSAASGNLRVEIHVKGEINAQGMFTQGGSVNLSGGGPNFSATNIQTQGGNFQYTTPGNLNFGATSTIATAGGDILFNVGSFDNSLVLASLNSSSPTKGGKIELRAASQNITPGVMVFGATDPTAIDENVLQIVTPGNITLNSFNNNGAGLLIGDATVRPNSVTFGGSIGNLVTNGQPVVLKQGAPLTLNRSITTNGGNITLDTSGDLTMLPGLPLNSGSAVRNSGAIALSSGGNIITNDLLSASLSGAGNAFNGGAISVTAPGAITVNGIVDSRSVASGTNVAAGNGGDISLNGQLIAARNFLSFSAVDGSGTAATGGAITLTTTSQLDLSAGTTIASSTSDPSLEVAGAGNTIRVSTGQGISNSLILDAGTSNLIWQGPLSAAGTLGTKSSGFEFAGILFTSGAQTHNNPILLTGSGSFLSNNAPITFLNTIDGTGAGGQFLTLGAGIGTITLNAPIGATRRIGDLFVNSSSVTTFNGNVIADQLISNATVNTVLNGDVTTVNQQRYFSPVQANGNRTLTSSVGILAFDRPIAHAPTDSLTLSALGGIYFASLVNVGNLTANTPSETRFGFSVNATSLTTDAGGTTSANGSITTTAFQTYNDNLQVEQPNLLLSSTGNGDLTFNGNTQAIGDLTTTTGGNQTFTGSVSTPGNLAINSGGVTDLRGDISANSLMTTADRLLLANNTLSTNTAQTYNAPTQVNGTVNLVAANNPITFNNTIAGDPSSTLIIDAGTAGVNFNRAVNLGDLAIANSGTVAFADTVNATSLTSNAANQTVITSNITTVNDQVYNSPVQINGVTVNLTSTNGDISFNRSVDGKVVGANSLRLNANRLNTTEKLGGITQLGNVAIATNQPLTLADSIDTQGGDVQVSANQITTRTIRTRGGRITLNSQSTVDTSAGTLDTTSPVGGDGGEIYIRTPGDLVAGNLLSRSRSNAGGRITLISDTAAVTAGNLDSSGQTAGGAIAVNAIDRITTRQINSSATVGNGGSVFLDPINNVIVDFINAQGGTNGIGGTVDITTGRFFQALDSFVDRNGVTASISTAGALGGGAVTIRHNGGFVGTPFEIGNASTNGTLGEITTGAFALNLSESFPYEFLRGNIHLVTAPQPIVPPQPQPQPQPQPHNNPVPDIPQTSSVPALSPNSVSSASLDIGVERLEAKFSRDYQDYYGLATRPNLKVPELQSLAAEIEKNTGVKPAFIYVNFLAEQPNQPKENDVLEIIVVTRHQEAIRKVLYNIDRATVLKTAHRFIAGVTDLTGEDYLEPAQQLHQWLISTIEPQLKARQINNLLFLMDEGLRSLPIAALHDGQQFLVERYSMGLAPSLTLTDTRYVNIKSVDLLAMGASQFKTLNALPAVPIELSTITQILQKGKSFLNENFTLSNLLNQRQQRSFGILHLATHGEFKSGQPDQSYIQFWDTQLRLDQIRTLGLNDPALELLILSACRTALGDEEAELGFGGLAAQAGVKSAIASLWSVSDEGTLGLMTELYRALTLPSTRIKAEALQHAQIAMLRGQITIRQGQMQTSAFQAPLPLPAELANLDPPNLAHPYYWSAFTMIGNPW